MPGLVIGHRRWIIGSDDLIVPGSILLATHLIWVVIYVVASVQHGSPFFSNCANQLTYHLFGQCILILGCAICELCIVKVSFRGAILDTSARSPSNYLLYIRLALLVIEIIWECYGLAIILNHATFCQLYTKEIIYSLKFYNLFIWLCLTCIIWCTFDPAGRSWVKMKKFQASLKDKNAKFKYRRSKSSQRNWRHREALREYEKTWDNRCRTFCCILCVKNPRENSFAEIAKLLSEFFRDLDVVPSDVIAGLSLMRVQQKAQRMERLNQPEEKIFQFLSGIAITGETCFLDLTHPLVVNEVLNLIHYLHYSLAIYGWPMYVMANSPAQWCKLLHHIKCCANLHCSCFTNHLESHLEPDSIVGEDYREQWKNNDLGDNCCLCNRAAIEQTCIEHNYKIIYLTYQVAEEKPPFFVAIDYDKMSIVVSIRGTLSPYDVLTDLNADYEILPINPPNDSWFGHKGMVSAASYIRSKLFERHLLERANEELKARDMSACVMHYPIIVVGHSLGAGTAAILAILLRQSYPNVICFAFAPPGGLLSESAAEYSKDFVISIVLGKDIVPRLGLHQMEKLRFDLIHCIKQCSMTKWGIIFKSCCLGKKDLSIEEFAREFNMQVPTGQSSEELPTDQFKKLSTHPNDESISLTVHTPLYPPGSIIHLVRVHPNKSDFVYESKWRQLLGKKKSIIQAIWTDCKDLNEILISPTMIKDHMPDSMLEALQDLLTTTGPQKPQRITDSSRMSQNQSSSSPSNESESIPTKVLVETSFTDSFNVGPQTDSLYHENRLRRLKSLVRKGRAPLATPEESSLSSKLDINEAVSAADQDPIWSQPQNQTTTSFQVVSQGCKLELPNILTKSCSDSELQQEVSHLKRTRFE